MIGIENPMHLVLSVFRVTGTMLVFAAATQGFFLVRSRWHESIALLPVSFTLFRPGYLWSIVHPERRMRPARKWAFMVAPTRLGLIVMPQRGCVGREIRPVGASRPA